MVFNTKFVIVFLSLLCICFKKTNCYLTRHEIDELYGEIKQLHTKNEECNNKYKKLIEHLLKNNINFNASEFLATSPYINNVFW